MTKPFYSLKNNCAAIEISGEEVGSFLNDILTAELNLLPVGKMQMSCLLSPQGRILHDMLIYRIRTDCFWIEINKNQILDLKNRLAIYKLRKKIEIQVIENWHSAHVFYENGKLFSLEYINKFIKDLKDGDLIFEDSRCSELGLHIVSKEQFSSTLIQDLEYTNLSKWEAIRIKNMVPVGNIDLTPNRTLMLEANLDMFSAVDFNKGCYIGQEVTARTKYRGLIKRKIVPISSKSILKKDMIIFQDQKEVGSCLSSVELEDGSFLALATLRLEAIKSFVDAKDTLNSELASVYIALPNWYDLKTGSKNLEL